MMCLWILNEKNSPTESLFSSSSESNKPKRGGNDFSSELIQQLQQMNNNNINNNQNEYNKRKLDLLENAEIRHFKEQQLKEKHLMIEEYEKIHKQLRNLRQDIRSETDPLFKNDLEEDYNQLNKKKVLANQLGY